MTTSDPAEPLLTKLPPDIRALVDQLRLLVRDVIPEATEKVHLGWGTIQYGVGGKMRDLVVAVSPQRAHVNPEFGDGVDLPCKLRRKIPPGAGEKTSQDGEAVT